MKRSWGFCIMAVFLTACASQSDVRILEDRLIALERRNLELQQQTAEVEREKSQIKSRIETYEETFQNKEQALRDQSAGLHATADRLRNEIQMVSGRLEETNYLANQKISILEQRMTRIEENLNLEPMNVTADVPPLPTATRPSLPPSTPPASEVATGTAATSDSTSNTVESSENEMYILAKQAFDNGDYQKAREGFQKLLLAYPDARYADNAQFWIGEIYYRERKYEQAILEYQTVIEKFPEGNKVQASLLKQGFAFLNMGDKANGRLILQDLVDKYPNSQEARIAQQKLKTL